VPAGTTLHCQPDAPEGKVEVVMDNDHLVGRNLEIPQHLAYSLTAAVHVSEGREENYFPSADRRSPPSGGKFALFQVHRKASSQLLQDSKAHIVAGGGIVSTRVSQSNNGNYLVHQFPLLALSFTPLLRALWPLAQPVASIPVPLPRFRQLWSSLQEPPWQPRPYSCHPSTRRAPDRSDPPREPTNPDPCR
jgi:hypothetical protein